MRAGAGVEERLAAKEACESTCRLGFLKPRFCVFVLEEQKGLTRSSPDATGPRERVREQKQHFTMVGIVRGLGGRKMRALLGPAESLQSWDPAVFGLKASQLDSETGFSSLSLVQGHELAWILSYYPSRLEAFTAAASSCCSISVSFVARAGGPSLFSLP